MSPYKDPEKRKQASLTWYHKNKDLEKIREYRREKRAKEGRKNKEWHRQYFYEYLGGECASCGTKENLEFDHIDPNTKCYGVSTILPETPPGYPYTERVWEEVDKCQLLCEACHKKKTYTLDMNTILEKRARNKQ
jgi:5-methylcytosine-specific restriction endonuclease McrA